MGSAPPSGEPTLGAEVRSSVVLLGLLLAVVALGTGVGLLTGLVS